MSRRLLSGLACLAALGCAAPAADVDSPRALAAALGCDYTPFTSVLGPGTEQGGCEYAGADLSLTVTSRRGHADALAEQLASDPRVAGVGVLSGDGWLVLSRDEAALRQAQDVLGGDLR